MKLTVQHWVIQYQPTYADEPRYGLYPFEMTGEDYATIGTMDVEIEIPDGFDAREQKIAILEKQRQKAMADHEALMNVIEGKIQSLRAIEYKELEPCATTAEFNTGSN